MSAAHDFHALAVMALADGRLAVQERDLLLRCAEWLGLPRPEAAWILGRVMRGGGGSSAVVLPRDPAERERLFNGLVNVAIADGVVRPEEERCLEELAGSFGVEAERVPKILNAALTTASGERVWPAGWSTELPPGTTLGGRGRLRPGSTVGGKFVLRELIGVGGYGRVFRARHTELREDVALKLLRLRTEGDALAEERFRAEVRAARSFLHRYAVPLREFGRDAASGALYFTMDLVDGFSLDSVLDREGRLAAPRAARLCLQALEALEEAHRQDLIHRDVKPGNMMLTRSRAGEEEVRLLDFGIAMAIHVTESSEEELAEGTGEPTGTLGYMSPEQARCERLDGRTDLYSMGVVLYELLSGRLPITADPEAADLRCSFMTRIQDQEPAPLEDDVPAPIQQVVRVALRKDPEARFETAAQFREALQRALEPGQNTSRFARWLSRLRL